MKSKTKEYIKTQIKVAERLQGTLYEDAPYWRGYKDGHKDILRMLKLTGEKIGNKKPKKTDT